MRTSHVLAWLVAALASGCFAPAPQQATSTTTATPWPTAGEAPATNASVRVVVLPGTDPDVGLTYGRYSGMPEVWFRSARGPDECHSPAYRVDNRTLLHGPAGYHLVAHVAVLPPVSWCTTGSGPDHVLFELLDMPPAPLRADVWATQNGTAALFHASWDG